MERPRKTPARAGQRNEDGPTDEATTAIARQIRQGRLSRGWSLAELAAAAGVAKATISKIERGEVSPTAVVLGRLAGAFGLTLARLFLQAEGAGQRLVRRRDQPVWRDPATGYIRRQVFSRSDHPIETVEIEFPPGQSVGFPASSFTQSRQLIWVRSGELVLVENGERHCLSAGDCFALGPPSDVLVANEGETPCTYLITIAHG